MVNQLVYKSEWVNTHNPNFKRLFTDLGEEMNKGIKDGMAYRLANTENDETKIFAFIKNEGYDIPYKEFAEFTEVCKGVVVDNEDFLKNAMQEQMSEELSDSDLEQVAGGKKLPKWAIALIAIGIAIVIAAAVVFTFGAGAVVAAAGGAAFVALAGASIGLGGGAIAATVVGTTAGAIGVGVALGVAGGGLMIAGGAIAGA